MHGVELILVSLLAGVVGLSAASRAVGIPGRSARPDRRDPVGGRLHFVAGAAGGIAIVLAAGWVIAEVRRRIDDPPIEVTISPLSGYAGYVPAERLGCSGVLAPVTVGVYVGWRAPEISTARMRPTGTAVWEVLIFLLNALLFVLIGLQLPGILEGLAGEPRGELVIVSIVVPLVVIASRLACVHVTARLIRAIDRRESQRARRAGWRQRTIIGWSGMRGSVSLAAALALPPDFRARDEVLLVAFAVILATPVFQGLTLPAAIAWAGVSDDGAEAREELLARRRATEAALTRLDELAEEEWTREDTIERMRGVYRYRTRRLGAGRRDR